MKGEQNLMDSIIQVLEIIDFVTRIISTIISIIEKYRKNEKR